jgi:hypothetical protein
LVSLPDWKLVAWRSGAQVCFLWRGEPGALEVARGCRPPLTSSLMMLIGETGPLTRLAGIAGSAVARVAVQDHGRALSVPTKALPVSLGRGLRFFFLQFRPHLSPVEAGSARWTLLALDSKGRPRGKLRV